MKISLEKRNKVCDVFAYIALAVSLLWHYCTLGIGIDISDTSYYLAHYKHFFSVTDAENFSTFLTDLIGALIYKITPSHQYLVFRFLGILCIDVAIICVWILLRNRMNRLLLSIGLLIGSVVINFYPVFLSYNSLSVLVLFIGGLLLVLGLEQESRLKIFFSGLVIGFSTFVRVPNILYAFLFLAVIWYDFFCKKNKQTIKHLLSMLYGGVLGLVIDFIIYIAVCGFDGINRTVSHLFLTSTSSTGSHGIESMIFQYINGLFSGSLNIVKYFSIIAIIVTIFAFLLISSKKVNNKIPIILTVILIGMASVFIELRFIGTTINCIYIIMVLSYISNIFFMFFFMKKNTFCSLVSFITIISSVMVCFGTDNALLQNNQCMILILPTLMLNTYTVFRISRVDTTKITKFTNAIIVFSVIITTICSTISFYEFGKYSLRARFRVNDLSKENQLICLSEYEGVKTTPSKVNYIHELSNFLSNEKYSDKKVFSLQATCASYVISDNAPFANNFWPDLNLTEFVEEAFKNISEKELPIIIIGDKSISPDFSELIEQYVRENIIVKNYIKALETDEMEIYVPSYLMED